MGSHSAIHIVGCLAEGEVGDVIIGGAAPPPGDTLWDQAHRIAWNDCLRRLIDVLATCKAQSMRVTGLPSFAACLDAMIEAVGLGGLKVDTGFGRDSFVLTDAASLRFSLQLDEARALRDLGIRITRAGTEQLGFHRAKMPDWKHISFGDFTGPVQGVDDIKTGRNTVVVDPGKLDRSPTGTGGSVRMAVLYARGPCRSDKPFATSRSLKACSTVVSNVSTILPEPKRLFRQSPDVVGSQRPNSRCLIPMTAGQMDIGSVILRRCRAPRIAPESARHQPPFFSKVPSFLIGKETSCPQRFSPGACRP